ncbi:hypothetical protein DM02DRAFT_609535, partial [Periconia macrospinosa]
MGRRRHKTCILLAGVQACSSDRDAAARTQVPVRHRRQRLYQPCGFLARWP